MSSNWIWLVRWTQVVGFTRQGQKVVSSSDHWERWWEAWALGKEWSLSWTWPLWWCLVWRDLPPSETFHQKCAHSSVDRSCQGEREFDGGGPSFAVGQSFRQDGQTRDWHRSIRHQRDGFGKRPEGLLRWAPGREVPWLEGPIGKKVVWERQTFLKGNLRNCEGKVVICCWLDG